MATSADTIVGLTGEERTALKSLIGNGSVENLTLPSRQVAGVLLPDILNGQIIRRRERKSEVIRVADLAIISPLVEFQNFTECLLLGPAIVAFLDDCQIFDPTFSIAGGNIDAMFWPVPDGAERFGAVGFSRCRFQNCRFDGIGIAATVEQIADIKNEFRQT